MQLLIVEQKGQGSGALARDLRRQGYDVTTVTTGTEARRAHRGTDLVLLNLELPDVDGLELCRAIRADGGTPVIAITNRDTELDRVLALRAGADDCVVRSCGFREVMARIEAVTRRARARPQHPDLISLCLLRIDRRTREVRLDGRLVEVTAKEFELLCALAATPRR
jgi:DNA-binding response OmpR family regulator